MASYADDVVRRRQPLQKGEKIPEQEPEGRLMDLVHGIPVGTG